MEKKIACVVVTFNRKALLKRCLDAIVNQNYKPKTVYIVDNASNDGTVDSVKEWGFYESERNGIFFKYILNSKNEGGAGGFYIGMKTAFETSAYDAIWVMDDDGVPAPNCLEILQKFIGKFDFISPLVLSLSDNQKSAFGEDRIETIIKEAKDDIIYNRANPFNGVLFSNKLIKDVGYPKREMFIWGDEMNYEYRCVNSGYIPITCIRAQHYHPDNRQLKVKTFLNRLISITDVDWKLYYLIRNQTYNAIYEAPGNKIRHTLGIFDNFVYYLFYFTFKSPKKFNKIVIKAFFSGIKKDFRNYKDVFGEV